MESWVLYLSSLVLGAPDKGFQKECPAVQNKDS